MKKLKMHLISIFAIVVMLIFALGTSSPVETELTVINNSSQNLKFRVSRLWSRSEYTEEFTLQKGRGMILRIIKGMNVTSPDWYITSVVIYNESGEIIKEFSEEQYSEENGYSRTVRALNFNFEGKKKGIWYYTLEINDELLE